MNETHGRKAAARSAAFAVRARAHEASTDAAEQLAQNVLSVLSDFDASTVVSAYIPIRSEIDPLPAMHQLHARGFPVCAPVVKAKGTPLSFRRWRPDATLESGAFDVLVPKDGEEITPDVILAPLLAFDSRGYRLGYGGGFYDRTIAELRPSGRLRVFGLAYAAQEVADLPIDDTDARLDGVITESGVRRFDVSTEGAV